MKIELEFKEGFPDKVGWYFVELEEGTAAPRGKLFDVDYFEGKDGLGFWARWYPHSISRYAEIKVESHD